MCQLLSTPLFAPWQSVSLKHEVASIKDAITLVEEKLGYTEKGIISMIDDNFGVHLFISSMLRAAVDAWLAFSTLWQENVFGNNTNMHGQILREPQQLQQRMEKESFGST